MDCQNKVYFTNSSVCIYLPLDKYGICYAGVLKVEYHSIVKLLSYSRMFDKNI